ncbi:thioredoxin domain-containing protein [Altererythrobacter soli]|uniref:Thioredoxin domain-containing protein n=1 Tax=Croceibacterium soli TaxID=1739690 RepID=A0A6I4USY3_9SPHN|nr:DsbA family protein [Croceibacterium soli]MXP40255.1 thioredoxin domain-containing protein [Croceibacterium soli]
MRWLITIVLALAGGFAGAAAWDFTGLGGSATREYILANPEVLPEAMERLQAQQRLARLEPVRNELERPFPGAVLGNPQGKVTLIEFSDYACGYCRQSVADVQKLIATNPDLRVVIREYPILSPQSADAARMSLAAAQQGKYAAFHEAMFRLGPPSAETIEQAAKEAGLDLAAAEATIASGALDSFLQTNMELANRLGISGTPGWVVGDRIIDGAVGSTALGEAIEEARRS